MSFVKSKLKAARESIANKSFAAARDAARQVLDYEPENYTASASLSDPATPQPDTSFRHVFLGLSLLNLGETDESEQVNCPYFHAQALYTTDFNDRFIVGLPDSRQT
jgi:superkiller protein 3